ncbi:CAP-Gly domain protein [Limoniibacter endophyticus]|uniref:CAP-Gly domain protein n=1 Tax=Limoniibacter endophyticus TaxID=1565040 RepID=A0A8J3DKS3_9HYPH|nr:CAP-Gly domain protein [Limoniibacter endophyticus]GHC61755.1 hypothetical protein GCM10010136_02500 [Limoniibacter endophyticus]
MTNFHVGQQVVCIDAAFKSVTIPQGLTEGQIYTLRWVGEFTTYVDGTFIGVRLEGVERGVDPTYGYEDPPFAARRFRPLVSDPISIFRQIAFDPNFKVSGPEDPGRKKEKVREKECVE